MLASFIAVDTETTGLDFEHDRIIELAAVRFENGLPTETFSALISPGDRVPSAVSRLITGITDDELKSAPPTADTLRAFLAFAGDTPLVAHNAEFDAHFVRRALEAESLPPLPGVWLDSLLLSRIAWPTWEAHRLDYLAERLAVPRDDEHRALPDARRAGYVFLAALQHLQTTLSPAGWKAVASLSSSLPDWSLVFTPDGFLGVNAHDALSTAAPGEAEQTSGMQAGARDALDALPAHAAFEEAVRALAEDLTALVGDEGWLALETPVSLDENRAGLNAALAHLAGRGAGGRVLLALPDNFAWNTLRKNLPETSFRMIALAEPSGYLCRTRLAALAAHPESVTNVERTALLPLVAWADRASSLGLGPVADGRGFSPDRTRLTWSRVACDTWNDDEAARTARAAAATADIILVTHATLCAHVASGGALLPACDAVIVTGAHRYPDVAHSPVGAGRAIALFRLREILQLWPTSTQAGEDDPWFAPDRELQKFLQKAGKAASKLATGGDFRVRYSEPVAVIFGADAEPVLAALRVNEDVLTARETQVAPDSLEATALRRIAARLRAYRADFELLTEASNPDLVYWIEDGANPHKATLRAAPRAMEGFGDTLRDLFGAGLFLSPALTSGGEAQREGRWFLRAAGLLESDTHQAAQVKRLSASTLAPTYLMAPFAPAPQSSPTSADQMEAYARFLLDATAPFTERGVLVFCPSQTAVRALCVALKSVLRAAAPKDVEDPDATPEVSKSPAGAPRVLAQWIDGNRDAIVRLYAAGRGGLVIASEGLPGLRDADDQAPTVWLLTRMPLPPPRDPLLEARGEPLREEGHNTRLELWQPAGVLRVKREWAMLHREGHTAPRALWLFDARAATEGLGARLGESLGANVETARNADELKGKTEERLRGLGKG
jgi:DNA polymerase III epsilon subunit family exonuclease